MFKNVAVVCNSRAERGPLQSVIAAMPGCQVYTVDVGGMPPDCAVRAALFQYDHVFRGFAGLRLVVVLGDRYETMAAALAAYFLKIPVAHIHGGECTSGSLDDAFRDAITHMATLHFAPTAEAQGRILMLRGYASLNYFVYTVGAPGLDGIPQNSWKRDRNLILVTYHPETRAKDYGLGNCKRMLAAFDELPGYEFMFTGVNNDPGHDVIFGTMSEWFARTQRGLWREDIGHDEYVGLMQRAALVVGNSSAGIIEAPWIGIPTVNIGDRQLGRPYADSVHQNDYDILVAIKMALSFKGDANPQYRGGAGEKIAAIVKEYLGVTGECRLSS